LGTRRARGTGRAGRCHAYVVASTSHKLAYRWLCRLTRTPSRRCRHPAPLVNQPPPAQAPHRHLPLGYHLQTSAALCAPSPDFSLPSPTYFCPPTRRTFNLRRAWRAGISRQPPACHTCYLSTQAFTPPPHCACCTSPNRLAAMDGWGVGTACHLLLWSGLCAWDRKDVGCPPTGSGRRLRLPFAYLSGCLGRKVALASLAHLDLRHFGALAQSGGG